jgi:hypothetical protein
MQSPYPSASSDHPRSSSDPLRPLHGISDQVWRELKANGTFNRPQEPETLYGKMTREVVRYEIGRQVMSHAEGGQMTDSEISQAIVKEISFTYRRLRGPAPFGKLGETLHETSTRTPTVVRKEPM